MALISCKECQKEISESAKTCPYCGVRVKPSILKWFFIVPIALFAVFMLFGAMIPEHTARANRFSEVCRGMAGHDVSARIECDKAEAAIRNPQTAQQRAEAKANDDKPVRNNPPGPM